MIIPCIRCGKPIDSPNAANADYIRASDLIVKERIPRQVLVPKTNEEKTSEVEALQKELQAYQSVISVYESTGINPQIIPIEDIYGEVEAIEEELADGPSDTKVVMLRGKLEDVQKTGIICHDCHKPDDEVIWGVHKK